MENILKAGLIGGKLGHSYSPAIHAKLGDYSYTLCELKEDELGSFLLSGKLDAMNVTLPYKKAVMEHLDHTSDEARLIGAVNTIVRKNGKLFGYNTDYYGFLYMLKKSGIDVSGKKCLVLGSGGASATVQAVLRAEKAAEIHVISRNGEDNYQNIDKHYDADVIVNTTPVGMYPEVDFAPLELDGFTKLLGVLDVIYNPARTKLLLDAERLGIKCANGLSMLVAQAKRASELFCDCEIDDSRTDEIVREMEQDSENIVLIGMPGCGKSTAGKALAELTGRQFVDLDEVIAQKAGISIPEIFEKHGEDYFRELEHQAVCEYGKQSGLVIATGGGVVKQERNYLPLHQNGRLIWLKRELSLLPTDGRPLSQAIGAEKLFSERAPLYERFCDASVNCCDNPNVTADVILSAYKALFKERK